MHILQAAPGTGKTALALQVAGTCGFPALYVTTEMGVLELFRRFIARSTKTVLGNLKSGEISAEEALRLASETAEKHPNFAFMDGMLAYASPDAISTAAESLRESAGAAQVLIVIDSIQAWARSARGGGKVLPSASEYDSINAAIDEAKKLAGNFTSPLLAISHRNRAGQKDGGLHAGKGSGDIEYMTETVIDLNPTDQQPDALGEITVKLTINKNRHGASGVSFPLRFAGRFQTFKNGR